MDSNWIKQCLEWLGVRSKERDQKKQNAAVWEARNVWNDPALARMDERAPQIESSKSDEPC